MAEVCQEEEENRQGEVNGKGAGRENFVDRKLQYVEKEKAPSPSQ